NFSGGEMFRDRKMASLERIGGIAKAFARLGPSSCDGVGWLGNPESNMSIWKRGDLMQSPLVGLPHHVRAETRRMGSRYCRGLFTGVVFIRQFRGGRPLHLDN